MRLVACGHDVVQSPLLEPVALAWRLPDEPVDAVIFTSPQGPVFAGRKATTCRRLPAYAVGARTAAAARDRGFADVRTVGGDVAALLDAVAADGHRRALHLAGAHRTAATVPAGLQLIVRAVYEARLVRLCFEAQSALRSGRIDWTLLFSARSAAHFALLFDALGADRSTLSIAAISPAVLAAAGDGWRRAVVAPTPDEAGILAASGLSCDKSPA